MTTFLLAVVAVSTFQAADTVRLDPISTVARHADAAGRLPLAVTVFTLDPARAVVGRSMAALLAAVPGVFVADRGNPSRDDVIAVRGAGARASFGVRGVRVFLDGIPQTLPDGQTQLSAIDPGSLARVEILRGAASAWYGNAAGGTVLFATAPPIATGVAVDVRGGGFGARRVAVSGVVGDGMRGLRAGVARETGAGWRRHASWETWRGSVSASGSLLGARNATHVTLTYQPLLEDPGALTAAELDTNPRMSAPAFLTANARKSVTHVQGGTALTWTRGHVAATVAVWAQRRDLRNPLPFVDITLGRTAGGVRASVDWIVTPTIVLGGGVEAQSMRDDRVNRDPSGTTIVRDQIESATEMAPWIQTRWLPHRAVTVRASARFDAVRFSAADRLLSDGDGSGGRSLTSPSVALGVSAAILPALRPWIGVATIFETPTTTELANRADGLGGFNPDLDPEHGVQLEAGLRGGTGIVTWETVAWRTWVRDGLVPFESPLEPGRIVYRNAGRVLRDGLEMAGTIRPQRLLAVEAALTVGDFRYQVFSTTAGTFDGNRVPGVPAREGTARAVLGTVALWLGLDVRARSTLVVNDANTATAAGWTTAGVRAGGATRVGGAAVAGWVAVENVFDARYVSAAQVNANGGRFYEPGAGRSLTVSISASRTGGGRSSSGR